MAWGSAKYFLCQSNFGFASNFDKAASVSLESDSLLLLQTVPFYIPPLCPVHSAFFLPDLG